MNSKSLNDFVVNKITEYINYKDKLKCLEMQLDALKKNGGLFTDDNCDACDARILDDYNITLCHYCGKYFCNLKHGCGIEHNCADTHIYRCCGECCQYCKDCALKHIKTYTNDEDQHKYLHCKVDCIDYCPGNSEIFKLKM